RKQQNAANRKSSLQPVHNNKFKREGSKKKTLPRNREGQSIAMKNKAPAFAKSSAQVNTFMLFWRISS
ncbi:MAG TPA: hypothetical protein PKD42_07495, partial [Chitinophagaceae bacterium]|nr:hypothetical protein [Chitinophagaceae bacterium]